MKNLRARYRHDRHNNDRSRRMIARCALPLLVFVGLALAQSPQEKAWEVLQAGASEKSTEGRAAAVRVLGLIPKDAKAVAMAEQALTDVKPEVRTAAASALEQMGAKGSVSKLKMALNDKEVSVAMAAA